MFNIDSSMAVWAMTSTTLFGALLLGILFPTGKKAIAEGEANRAKIHMISIGFAMVTVDLLFIAIILRNIAESLANRPG